MQPYRVHLTEEEERKKRRTCLDGAEVSGTMKARPGPAAQAWPLSSVVKAAVPHAVAAERFGFKPLRSAVPEARGGLRGGRGVPPVDKRAGAGQCRQCPTRLHLERRWGGAAGRGDRCLWLNAQRGYTAVMLLLLLAVAAAVGESVAVAVVAVLMLVPFVVTPSAR